MAGRSVSVSTHLQLKLVVPGSASLPVRAGLRYDVTLLHDDGSTTDVEVDTVTGRVTSIDHDRDGD
jgi:hypothetical protein